MTERTKIIVRLISTHIVLPLFFIAASFMAYEFGFILLALSQTILIILFLSGYWEFFSRKFKLLFSSFLQSLIVFSFFTKLYLGSHVFAFTPVTVFLIILEIFLIIKLLQIIIVINEKKPPVCEIEFPFKNGEYLITDGGNSRISRLMNYHFYSPTHKKQKTNYSMLYAVDIVKIAKDISFLPLKNEDYPIFSEKIFSPIAGTVIKVINDIPDNISFSGNYPYNTGNTVVIKNNSNYMLLGHLKYGCISVSEGDEIKANHYIGLAGNSGWTERPHLHMQLINSNSPNFWQGTGINITFRDKNLYKNRRIILNNQA